MAEEKTKAKPHAWIWIPVVVVVMVSAVGGCQEKPEGPLEKITLAAYAGETAALVYVAEDQGYFKIT